MRTLSLNLLRAFVFVGASLTTTAFAATQITLPKKNFTLSGEALKAFVYDLGAEVKKASGLNAGDKRLLQVDVKVQGSPTGATFGLVVGGIVMDSTSTEDDREIELQLLADSTATPAPWQLAVRGQARILEIRLTYDETASGQGADQGTLPPGNVGVGGGTPGGNTPETNPGGEQGQGQNQGSRPDDIPRGDLRSGDRVFVRVRMEEGERILPATVVRQAQNGRYSVRLDDSSFNTLDGVSRQHMAIPRGCSKTICVGDFVTVKTAESEGSHEVFGIFPDGSIAIEGRHRPLVPADVRGENSNPTPVVPPAPIPPAPIPAAQDPDMVNWVQNDGQVLPARLLAINRDGARILITREGFTQEIRTRADQIAVMSGCTSGRARVCVGEILFATDGQGRQHRVRVVGLQVYANPVVVTLEFIDLRLTRGGWPLGALSR